MLCPDVTKCIRTAQRISLTREASLTHQDRQSWGGERCFSADWMTWRNQDTASIILPPGEAGGSGYLLQSSTGPFSRESLPGFYSKNETFGVFHSGGFHPHDFSMKAPQLRYVLKQLQCLNMLSFDLAVTPFSCMQGFAAFHGCCHYLWLTAGHTEMLTVLLKEPATSPFC